MEEKEGGRKALAETYPRNGVQDSERGLETCACLKVELTLRESVASDIILSHPLKVATWKRER